MADTAPTQADVYDAGVRLLARREHATAELRRKLRQRFDEPELIEAALAELTAAGYLSDARYAEARLRSGLARGHGPQKIRQTMRQAGVDDAEIANAFGAEDIDWAEAARMVLQKRFGEVAAGDHAERGRRARFLISRGYPKDIVARLVLSR